MGDTLNHLARMHVLAAWPASPELQRFYVVHWAPIPYLAMDAIVPFLARIMPIYEAGKLFVCACVLLPAVAVMTLHYVVHRRVSLVPAAAFLLCTNYLLALGFLNYLFAMSCAVLLFAGWLAASAWPRWRRAALFAPLVLLLYLGHAFACLAYCLAVAGTELAAAARGRDRVAGIFAAAAQAVPALGCAATLHVASGYLGPLETSYGSPAAKLMAAASPMLFLADRTTWLTIMAAVAVWLACRRYLRLAARVWPAALAVMTAALAVPHVLASTWGTDLRLPIVASMLLVGAASWSGPPGARRAILAIVLCLASIRSADSWVALHDIDAQVGDTRRIVTALPRGARLLLVNGGGHGTGTERVTASTLWHMPLVAVIDRDAFVPILFTGLTTVAVQPAFRLSSTPNGLPISPDQLRQGATDADDGVERDDGHGARLYFHGWPAKFDYVLVQSYGADAGAMPDVLTQVARAPGLVLYRVGH